MHPRYRVALPVAIFVLLVTAGSLGARTESTLEDRALERPRARLRDLQHERRRHRCPAAGESTKAQAPGPWSPDGTKLLVYRNQGCVRHQRGRERRAEPDAKPGVRLLRQLVARRTADRVRHQP